METFNGTRVDAIKKIREVAGLSLTDSKKIVDALFPSPLSFADLRDLIDLLNRFRDTHPSDPFDQDYILTALEVVEKAVLDRELSPTLD